MSADESAVEQVYSYICQYVTDMQALPSYSMVGAALGLNQPDLLALVACLRQQGRIAPITLLPTIYADWWREHMRVHWSYRAMRLS